MSFGHAGNFGTQLTMAKNKIKREKNKIKKEKKKNKRIEKGKTPTPSPLSKLNSLTKKFFAELTEEENNTKKINLLKQKIRRQKNSVGIDIEKINKLELANKKIQTDNFLNNEDNRRARKPISLTRKREHNKNTLRATRLKLPQINTQPKFKLTKSKKPKKPKSKK